MAATTDSPRVGSWLRGRLSTLSLPVFWGAAPEGEKLSDGTIVFPRDDFSQPAVPMFPAAIFRRQGGTDIVTLAGGIVAVRSVWLCFVVKPVASQPESDADILLLMPYADSLHAALINPNFANSRGRLIHDVRRESEYESSIVENNTAYQQLGGVYKAWSTLA